LTYQTDGNKGWLILPNAEGKERKPPSGKETNPEGGKKTPEGTGLRRTLSLGGGSRTNAKEVSEGNQYMGNPTTEGVHGREWGKTLKTKEGEKG